MGNLTPLYAKHLKKCLAAAEQAARSSQQSHHRNFAVKVADVEIGQKGCYCRRCYQYLALVLGVVAAVAVAGHSVYRKVAEEEIPPAECFGNRLVVAAIARPWAAGSALWSQRNRSSLV